jgi:REP element-mobilizing transposase RayT
MSNHLHLIISSQINRLSDIMRDFKKYTSKQIIIAIQNNERESRKTWMLNMFGYAGRGNNDNKDFQFWRNGYHPIVLDSPMKIEQRLTYLHENPVKAGIVREPQDYKYSSAIDYYTKTKGLLTIEHL